jgi:hypothetical protein
MAVQSLLAAKIMPSTQPMIQKVLTWTAPAIAIPALRYTQDTHLQRKELFIRDASTYSIGALLFLGTEWAAKKLFDHTNLIQNLARRDLAAFMVGLTVNLLYAGIGAVRLSQAFARYQSKAVKTPTLPKPTHFKANAFAMPENSAPVPQPIDLQPNLFQLNTRM